MDVCLLFREDFPPTGSGFREIGWTDVEEIFREAQKKHLVARPFRNQEDVLKADGICFCCDDCCGYFLNPAERCDQGESIAVIESERCHDCGACVEVCYFGARQLSDGELMIDREKCYGCGLCVDVCPEDCLEMGKRN
jgi:ferredoxin